MSVHSGKRVLLLGEAGSKIDIVVGGVIKEKRKRPPTHTQLEREFTRVIHKSSQISL